MRWYSGDIKITDDLLETLRSYITPLDTEDVRQAYRDGRFPRSDRVKDLDKRYRWDLLAGSRFNTVAFYDAGLNDTHIDTALRSIVPPLSDRKEEEWVEASSHPSYWSKDTPVFTHFAVCVDCLEVVTNGIPGANCPACGARESLSDDEELPTVEEQREHRALVALSDWYFAQLPIEDRLLVNLEREGLLKVVAW